MSRTFRNRTPYGKINAYARHEFTNFSNRPYYRKQTQLTCIDLFLKDVIRFGNVWKVPKKYRKFKIRSKKRKDIQILYVNLKYDTLDNMTSFKWSNDAGYHYW